MAKSSHRVSLYSVDATFFQHVHLAKDNAVVSAADLEPIVTHQAGPAPVAAVPQCSVCAVVFDTAEEQRAHFKLDWHLFNVKRKLLQKDATPISEEQVG